MSKEMMMRKMKRGMRRMMVRTKGIMWRGRNGGLLLLLEMIRMTRMKTKKRWGRRRPRWLRRQRMWWVCWRRKGSFVGGSRFREGISCLFPDRKG